MKKWSQRIGVLAAVTVSGAVLAPAALAQEIGRGHV